jgi:FkbH-like protein
MDVVIDRPTLTPDLLTATRWVWQNSGGEIFTKSFYFGADGLIKIYVCGNEHSWELHDGNLRIFDKFGNLFWIFEPLAIRDDRMTLKCHGIGATEDDWWMLVEHTKAHTSSTTADTPHDEAEAKPGEGIRLIIWDLDETFWTGTLSEGGITPIQRNIDLVKTLTDRGIVNAICSKNHFEDAKQALTDLGIWDHFVFPEISFAPKGAMIKSIVRNIQLRPATIMFIDDNAMNLNEAEFYVPGLKTADPAILDSLLTDPRFTGKPDPDHARLARYKILETKHRDQSSTSGDNEQFLRNSNIRVSLHSNIEDEFPRIHDLVNRTNQLNFTKNRWPEDPAEALAQFRTESEEFGTHTEYVKVADRYGNYGITGFYMMNRNVASHFLFSCRTMNMGVEQFVWNRIGKPSVRVRGDVVSDIDMEVDWIELVHDADDITNTPATPATQSTIICIRGACDMMMTSQFLRARATVIEEFNYIYKGWEICPLPYCLMIHDEAMRPENQAILARLPGFPKNRFESAMLDDATEVCVLSFSQETFCGYYRIRSTGLVLPLMHHSLWPYDRVKRDYTHATYDEILALGVNGVTEDQWTAFRDELEFIGGFDEQRFIECVRWNLTYLKSRGKRVIVVGLNDQVGRDAFVMEFFGMINRIVRPLVAEHGGDYIDINRFVHTEDDLAKDDILGGAHYSRLVYAQVAEAIQQLAAGSQSATSPPDDPHPEQIAQLIEPPNSTRYARAVGLGFSCSTATLLKSVGVRTESLPFDWIFSSPSIVAAALTSEFELFLDPRYLRPDANLEKCHHDFFENVLGVPGPIFPHHNPTTPEHRQYFERTLARMRDIMASPEPLFLYAMYQNPIPADHLESFFATLERSFKNFTFLLYNWTHSPDQADQPPVTETIRDRFIIHRQFTRSKMKEGVLFDDETDNIRAREVFLQHYNVPAEHEAAAEPQTPPLPETLTLPALKKSIIITSLPQGYPIFQLLSSIPTLAAHLNFEFLDNDAITDRFTRIDDQSRTNIAGIIEQTTSFYPGLDRAVAQGQWLWFTFPHVRIDGYFPFAGHDPRFTAPDPAYPTGRAPFTDRIAAATALAVHESGKPVTDDELFDLYMRATEAELPFAADNILMDFRRIIDHDVRTHVKLLDYIYTNHKTTRMVYAPEALTGTLIGKIASDLLDAMLPNLPVDAERCRAELRYLLTGYEGEASVQTPIHPALARHLGLDWIIPDTTYRIFGNRWTFRQAMIHYLRASPWLL